jgi:hypothetical protein
LRSKRTEVGLHHLMRILILDFMVPSWLFDTRDFALFVWEIDRAPPVTPSDPTVRLETESDTALLCDLGRSRAEIWKRLDEGRALRFLYGKASFWVITGSSQDPGSSYPG